MLRKSQSYRGKKRKVGIPGGGDISVSAFTIFPFELSCFKLLNNQKKYHNFDISQRFHITTLTDHIGGLIN